MAVAMEPVEQAAVADQAELPVAAVEAAAARAVARAEAVVWVAACWARASRETEAVPSVAVQWAVAMAAMAARRAAAREGSDRHMRWLAQHIPSHPA